jgi:hypothetical protein
MMRSGAAVALAAALVAGACTGERGGGGPNSSPEAPPTTGAPAEPGTYTYDFNGVAATFKLEGAEGTLEIRNGTGIMLAAPRISVVLATDGRTLQATVAGASSLRRNAREDFEVTLPRDLEPRDVGIVLLAFGEEAWGALSPGG